METLSRCKTLAFYSLLIHIPRDKCPCRQSLQLFCNRQWAKKVVSDSPGLVDFAIGVVNSVLNLPDGQVKFFEEFKLKKNCQINSARQNFWGGLVEMTFWASIC